MSAESLKSFAPIRDDYTFFETHSTEAASDLDGYARFLPDFSGPVHVLDFGCGPGGFSAKFLARLGVSPSHLLLALVEPEDGYRQSAVSTLKSFTTHPLEAWAALPPDCIGCFDLAVCNHALYYVPDLDTDLGQILASLAPGGRFLTAIAGLDNILIQFWVQAFRLLGRPIPYHTAEDVEAALRRLGQAFQKHRVSYELIFPDEEENRMKILRFLLSEHLAELPRQAALDLFAPYAQAGQIVLRTGNDQFVVGGV